MYRIDVFGSSKEMIIFCIRVCYNGLSLQMDKTDLCSLINATIFPKLIKESHNY